jgi:3-oxoadipate enol-lactonase
MELTHPLDRSSALPPGRRVTLPGRGDTFVRELIGPPGAPRLVLLHGWGATADLNWCASYPALRGRYHVVAPDHRGHGRGLRSEAPFTLEDCADDVAALIDVLGIAPAIVVGYSMGGPIAQLVWRRHPGLVDGLVLCATSQRFSDTRREQTLFALLAGLGALVRICPARKIGSALAVLVAARRSRLPSWAERQLLRHDWRQIIEAGQAIGAFDSRPWLSSVDVPVATVTTLSDDVVPTHRQIELTRAVQATSQHVVHGGHAACLSHDSGVVGALVAACQNVATVRAAGRSDVVLAA